jgi:hypothetical protein
MATFPTAPVEQPPPTLPSIPNQPEPLTNYLRSFSLWCRHGFRAKLDSGVALPGIMLQANDAPAGTAPAIWYLQVNTAGSVIATRAPLGGGSP